MVINSELLLELCRDAGTSRQLKAERYVKEKRVNITKVIYDDANNFELRSKVRGSIYKYQIYIKVQNNEIEDVSCDCQDYETHFGTCKHILATMMEFSRNPEYVKIFTGIQEKSEDSPITKLNRTREQNHNFKQLLNVFYEESQENNVQSISMHNVRLVPTIIIDRFQNKMKIEFKIGETQMYKLKSLPEFYENVLNENNHRYGNKLEFVHSKDAFNEESIPLLEFILKYAEIIKYSNETASHYGYYGRMLNESSVTISNTGLDDLFEIMKDKFVVVQTEMGEEKIHFIDSEPNINFNIEEVDKYNYKISPNIDIYEYKNFKGKNYSYFLYDDKMYKCSKKFEKTIVKLLEVFRSNFIKQIEFNKNELSDIFSMVVPKIKNNIKVDKLNPDDVEKYMPKELYTKVYLDYDKNNYITADIKFCYDDIEFNPLLEDNIDVARDSLKESETLDKFRRTGFMLDVQNARLILAKEEDIFNFLSNQIEDYMNKFEVLATDKFKEKEIREPKISSLGVRVENNLLEINFDQIDFDPSEISKIMEKYKLKKKFHRLKDGSFIKLDEENSTIDFLGNIAERIRY